MRVHSTYEVDPHPQHNPLVSQNAGLASAGNSKSGPAFIDYLKQHLSQNSIQQTLAPATTGHVESQVAGMYWGFASILRVQQRTEPTPEENAS